MRSLSSRLFGWTTDMITRENFKELLTLLQFEDNGTIHQRYFPQHDAWLKVDFGNSQLLYPEDKGLTINERQTCNFSSKENFVVFECVHRLLQKGYKPEHIELEPKWKVGHGASGGRADILVKDNTGKPLLIVECKTEGSEFNKAWQDTLRDGGQLFTYAHQQRSTKFVCLYASDLTDQQVRYQSYMVALTDNAKLLDEYKDRNPLAYAIAQDYKELYQAWRETYALDFATKGIFEDDIQPYLIGKLKFTLNDLETVGNKDIQRKYHQFATILRQHNVSGRENAFDKLVNLFLCKIVDEATNPTDLKFYWKGIAYDSYFELQDRLQKLYQDGMKRFLGEDVTYIDNSQIDSAFRYVTNDPDATRDTIKKFFRQLKFFTNNDFAFVDVHNEKLFFQNADVLLKMVRLFQDMRLQNDEQNQFLGDMFEGFLDQGVKQSEGQFFTPMPITKFIMMSLPLEQLIRDSQQPPRAIDYACGAGHFLNEMALQIKPFIETHKAETSLKSYYQAIYGIEKEYRLSKVSKVSAFMYGQNDIQIIYADTLAQNTQIPDGTFSVLVANPPYSVKGFLETLPDADRQRYALYGAVDPKTLAKNNAIETFFIERAKQLLRPGGIAAIIVPSSILSNTKALYIRTREILLQFFDIVAIAELGSGTFGKTGTNTVTLFLRRKAEDPAPADHYRNRVDAWFKGDATTNKVFADEYILQTYCQHLDIARQHYQTLLNGHPSDELLTYDLYKDYKRAFEDQTDIKNLRKGKFFKGIGPDEQQLVIDGRFLSYLRGIEKDKLYHFALAQTNPQPVVIIKSPGDNKEQKTFLGYEWSSAKGNEGIKYLAGPRPNRPKPEVEGEEEDEDVQVIENLNNLSHIQTALYDPQAIANPEKLNYAVQQAFLGEPVAIPDALQPYLNTARLVDMLDFGRKEFSKAFSLNPAKRNASFTTTWELIRLGDFVDTIESGNRPPGGVGNINEGALSLGGEHIHHTNGGIDLSTPKYVPTEFFEQAKRGILKENDILLCKDGALTGKVGLLRNELNGQSAMVNEHVFILRCHDLTKQLYLFNLLFSIEGQAVLKLNVTGAAQGGLNSTNLINIKIPLPPADVQVQIVAKCEAVDAEVSDAQKNIAVAKQEIDELITGESVKGYPERKIADIALINPSKTEIRDVDENTLVSFVEMASVSNDGFITAKQDRPLHDLKKGSYTYFREDDIIIAKITPCMENGKCALATRLTNGLAMGSSEFHVVRTNNDVSNQYVFALLNRDLVRKQAEQNMTGSSGHRRVPASFYESYRIPVPPLPEQLTLVANVKTLEQRITDAQSVINGSAARKQAVMQRYLTEEPQPV